MRVVLVVTVLLATVACGQASPAAPSAPSPAPQAVFQYDINIPDLSLVLQLQNQYPQGVVLSPVEAQVRYDYTNTYGTANVYGGEINLSTGSAGFATAPAGVASKRQFEAREWPLGTVGLSPDTICSWLGHFVFALRG